MMPKVQHPGIYRFGLTMTPLFNKNRPTRMALYSR
jgi:hypothetical protein